MIENMKSLIIGQKSALLAKQEVQNKISDAYVGAYVGMKHHEETFESLHAEIGIKYSLILIDQVLEILDSKLLLEAYRIVRAHQVVFNALIDRQIFPAPLGAYKVLDANAKILSDILLSDDFMTSIRE